MFEKKYLMLSGFLALCPLIPLRAMDIHVAPLMKEQSFIKKTLSQSTICKLEIVDMIPTDESTMKRRIDDYMNLAMKFYHLKVHELQSHPRNMAEINSLYISCSDCIFASIYLGGKIGISREDVIALFDNKSKYGAPLSEKKFTID